MYTLSMGRKDFVSWLGDRSALPARDNTVKSEILDVQSGEVLLVWSKKPTLKTPESPLIVVPDGDLVDFFAFVSTYVGSYKPFSAFFNVIGLGGARRIFNKIQGLPENILSRFVAVVIAEAYVQMGGKKAGVADVPVSACFGTFSDSVIQMVNYDDKSDQIDELADRWSEARDLLGGEMLPLSVEELIGFWKLVLDGLAYESKSYSLLQEPTAPGTLDFIGAVLLGRKSITLEWEIITENLPAARNALKLMDGSREARVRAFDEAITEILASGHGAQSSNSIVAGYLAARVGGGSLQYLSLAYDLFPKLKLAPLWFALFSSFTPGSDYIYAGDSLGRRLARERVGRRGFWEDSQSDISLDELRVVSIDDMGVPRTRRLRQSTIEVEIFPKVSATFRVGRRKINDDHEVVLKNRNNEIRYLLDKISNLLETKDDRNLQADRSREKYSTGRKVGRQKEF
ncbi:hypothetical protein [Pseudomonas syringae]|uniref:hypothetical protein n=1 Tax=Pseudomonas syringae TaxID=317 RepID=UPI001BD0F31A|nr:hypothetical protein [Pseudomonas syringae]MBS7413370.1 hypothetical protein [Pseudomonas syringae]MBS7471196.1 hypothetical protein [Pseudomonas syringae]